MDKSPCFVLTIMHTYENTTGDFEGHIISHMYIQ